MVKSNQIIHRGGWCNFSNFTNIFSNYFGRFTGFFSNLNPFRSNSLLSRTKIQYQII